MMMKIPHLQKEQYILLLQRNVGGMFNGGQVSAQTAFFVDGIHYLCDKRGVPYAVQGFRDNATDGEFLVTEFVYGMPFTLLERDRVRFITPVDAAKQQKEEQSAIEKLFEGTAQQPAAEQSLDSSLGVKHPMMYL